MCTNSFSNYLALIEQKGTSTISKGKARLNKPAELLGLSYRQCVEGNHITPVKEENKNTEIAFWSSNTHYILQSYENACI